MRTDVYQKITNQIVTSLSEASGRGSSRGTPEMGKGALRGPCAPTAFPIRASMS